MRSGAAIIMCSPCCHKQIRLQIQSPALLKPMLQYGMHLGQQAEMVTDSLRALFLEACGYETKVFEFVSLEHTNKNKMILAARRARPLSAEARADLRRQIDALKGFYGVREHCLETLLSADRAAPEAASATASAIESAMATAPAIAPAVATASAPETASAPPAGADADRGAGPAPGPAAGR